MLTIAPPAVIGRIDAAAAMQRTTSASVGENADAERAQQQRAAEGARRPAAEQEAAGDERRAGDAGVVADALEDPFDPVGAIDERQPHEPRPEGEHA